MTEKEGTTLSRRALLGGAAAASVGLRATAGAAASGATALFTHPACEAHRPGAFIVERPARLKAVADALSGGAFSNLSRRTVSAREDLEEAILRAHARAYVDDLKQIAQHPERLPHPIDGDTVLAAGTWEAALHAVGAGLDAVDAVMRGDAGVRTAFCAIRPPGHHAEPSRAMGFCFFSNVAIAALYARARHGAQRVAVVDFDVHHGNGTQKIFWADRDLFYGSTHEMPLFPGTGAASESGVGNIFNAPLAASDGSAQFRSAMSKRILPALASFKPDLVLISAGFDAHEADPLGHLRLSDADFAWITDELVAIAAQHCAGRIVSMLEGGYDLGALSQSVSAHVRSLMKS